MLYEPGSSPLWVAVADQFAPLSILYSSVPLPDALTTIVPVGVAHVGCVTVGAVIAGAVQHPVAAVSSTGFPL